MKNRRLDIPSNTIISHLNINSFRNKFFFVEDIIKLVDMFLVSKSKLDHMFRVTYLELIVTKFFDLTEIILEGDEFFI